MPRLNRAASAYMAKRAVARGDDRSPAPPRPVRYLWVPIPAQETIIARILQEIDDVCDPDSRPVIVLSGPSGMGKSLLLRELERRCLARHQPPPDLKPGHRHKPLLRSILSSASGPQNVAIDIRHWQGFPTPSTHYPSAQNRVIEAMAQQGTRALAVDRASTILDHGPRTQQEVLKVIGYIGEAASVPVILAGTMAAKDMFTRVNDPYAVLADRAIYLKLERWELDDRFQKLLLAFGEGYELQDFERIAEESYAERFHELSFGTTRGVARGLRRAMRLMEAERANALSLRHVEEAFGQFRP